MQRDNIALAEARRIMQFRQPNSDWRKLSDRYLELAFDDLLTAVDACHSVSRPCSSPPSQIPLPVNYNIEYKPVRSLQFEATVSTIGDRFKKTGLISISLGSFLALDDLFSRMASNHGFFNVVQGPFFDIAPWPVVWPELAVRCHYNNKPPKGALLQPCKRYEDYTPRPLGSKGWKHFHENNASFLSHFFSAFPYSNNRFCLARTMTTIGLMWLMLHEETHFIDGHFGFVTSQLGVANPCNHIVDNAARRPGMLQKVMEWNADHGATQGLFDIVMSNPDSFLYRTSDEKGNGTNSQLDLLRLLMTTIGTITILFRRLELSRGCSQSYPSSYSRLTTLFHTVAKSVLITRTHHGISQSTLAKAIALSMDDLFAVANVLGLDYVANEAGLPMYAMPNRGEHGLVGLFDSEEECLWYFLKLLVQLGFENPLPKHDVTPINELVTDLDRLWFEEYIEIIKEYDNHYFAEFRKHAMWNEKSI